MLSLNAMVSMWQRPNAYFMDNPVVVPRERAELNITTVSKTLQFWHERLSHQDKRRVRKLLESLHINFWHRSFTFKFYHTHIC
jgi:hypothetical protein